MSLRVLAAVAVTAAACGDDSVEEPPQDAAAAFVNTYAGTLVRSLNCSFGPLSGTEDVVWAVGRANGGGLEVADNGCVFQTLEPEGSHAAVLQATCPTRTTSSGSWTRVITGGSLDLSGTTLAVTVNANVDVTTSSGVSGKCSETRSGTLTARQSK